MKFQGTLVIFILFFFLSGCGTALNPEPSPSLPNVGAFEGPELPAPGPTLPTGGVEAAQVANTM